MQREASGGKALAPLGPPPRQNLAPADTRHALTEAVAALADEAARLISALHSQTFGEFFAGKRGLIGKGGRLVNHALGLRRNTKANLLGAGLS